jgi:uncharacterized protein YwgA
METKSLDNATFLTLIDEFTEIAKRVDIYLKKGDMFLLQIEPTKPMTKAEIELTVKEIRRLLVIKGMFLFIRKVDENKRKTTVDIRNSTMLLIFAY